MYNYGSWVVNKLCIRFLKFKKKKINFVKVLYNYLWLINENNDIIVIVSIVWISVVVGVDCFMNFLVFISDCYFVL